MSDFLTPPPRRPAPAELRQRVAADLQQTPARRLRPRQVLIPLAAASLVGAVALGVSTVTGQTIVAPAVTASPAPASATAPTPASTTAPTPPTADLSFDLDVRPMTRAEIAADTSSCLRPDPTDKSPVPRRGTPRTVYAMVEQSAGVAGPLGQVRILITQDDTGGWACENGVNLQWLAGGFTRVRPSAAVPAVEVPNYGGGSGGKCAAGRSQDNSSVLYAVSDAVRVGRVRVVRGGAKGPWQRSEPRDGYVHFRVSLTGADAWAEDVSVQFQLLGGSGAPLTIQPYGPRGTRTATTDTEKLITCADLGRWAPPAEPLERPTNDRAGVQECLVMAKESASGSRDAFDRGWGAKLVYATTDEWGAVLSNGNRRFGCSLFPTKEISAVVDDTPAVTDAGFAFALNPIDTRAGAALWAAGRVPAGVTGISYRLPGDQEVTAELTDGGYWMVKATRRDDRGIDRSTPARTWDPVVVSVSQPSGDRSFSLRFTEETMCNQVSHGC